MARELKTGWLAIATSGSVVAGSTDGRKVEKEWLDDMAGNYNTQVHTAKLWPDHRRYWNFGKVLALKVQPSTIPELKGEITLFAIIAPNNNMIRANVEGEYTFPSIEVGEDFHGTGKFYLRGLGLTDEPASVGVQEVKFSEKGAEDKTAFLVPGHELAFSETTLTAIEEAAPGLATKIKNIFRLTPDDPTPEGDDMTPEQIAKLRQDITEDLSTSFSEMLKAALPAPVVPPKEPAAPESGDFSEKQKAFLLWKLNSPS